MFNQSRDTHLFLTDHPYFIQLGLGNFTIWSLIEWWNQKDHKGRYLNRRHIYRPLDPEDKLEDKTDLKDLLGLIYPSTPITWEGWKPNPSIENAGVFKKQSLFGFCENTGAPDSKWYYKVKTDHSITQVNDLVNALDLLNKNPFHIGSFDINSKFFTPYYSTDPTPNYFAPLKSLKAIYGLIQLHKIISNLLQYYPKVLWPLDTTSFPPLNSVGGVGVNQALAAWAFLTEIQAAKSGPFVQWTGPVTFYVQQNNGLLDCKITEDVTFKLYIGDHTMLQAGQNTIAFKDLNIVSPKLDTFSAPRGVDGATELPNNNVAGKIDLSYNPVTQKFQSGNVNVFAKLVTDIKPAYNIPSVNDLLDIDIKEMLDDVTNKNAYIPSRGSGMPIRVQNGMTAQWGPNYSSPSRCDEDKTKLVVPVYNFNPKRFYAKDEDVLLTLIDGLWHVTSLGEPNTEPPSDILVGPLKWGPFTYLATSSQFFFKGIATYGNTTTTVSLTPRDAELNFHKRFYSSFNINNRDKLLNNPNDNGLNYGASGGYDLLQSFNTTNYTRWHDLPGYYQITSFDFLDSKICGIRGKAGSLGQNGDLCAISSTSATITSNNSVLPSVDEYSTRNSAHTGTFFGCVFPAGYQGTEVYDAEERSWSIQPTGTTTVLDYFSSQPTQDQNPFENNQARNNSNAKCRAVNEGGKDNLIAPDNQGFYFSNLWTRGTTNEDAGMFYLGANEGRKTIPADVMLNASPSGNNGSPIKPISLYSFINEKHQGTGDFTGYINNVFHTINGGVWLCKSPKTGGVPVNINDSAFDFTPTRKTNLMFRPLKLEAYLQFGCVSWLRSPDTIHPLDEALYGGGKETNYAKNLDVFDDRKVVEKFYTEAARTQKDFTWPISYYVPQREFNNCKANIAGYESSQYHITGGPLKWGSWTTNRPNYTRLHKSDYWNEDVPNGALAWSSNIFGVRNYLDWLIDPNINRGWDGAGAFGIITTSLKVKTNEKIQFSTSNLYGMGADSELRRYVYDNIGGFLLFGDGGGVSSSIKNSESWGVSNFINSYKQENIIDLSVRIYQGHPQDQTIYDPRYFAVHHFNPGVYFLYGKYKGIYDIPVNDLAQTYGNFPIYPTGENNNKVTRNLLKEDFTSIRGILNVPVLPSYIYPDASGVDIKIPSRYQKFIDTKFNDADLHQTATYYPDPLIAYTSETTSVFSRVFFDGTLDATIDGLVDSGNLKPPLLPEKNWLVDTSRTGKLLPYRYVTGTLTAPIREGDTIEPFLKGSSFDVDETPAFKMYRTLFTTNFGNNYVYGDIVGLPDYGVLFRVEEVKPQLVLSLEVAKGPIKKLRCISSGSGIPISFCQPTGTLIKNIENPGFVISNVTVASGGAGFTGFFVCADYQAKFACDRKPLLIRDNGGGDEIVRIAAPISKPNFNSSDSTEIAEKASFIKDSHKVDFNITPALKSKDGIYDIFFHFHNDISMTWLAGGQRPTQPWGDAFNPTECAEQHVTIEAITLT